MVSSTTKKFLGQEKLETLPVETTPEKAPFQIPFNPQAEATPFVHPSLLLTREKLAFMKHETNGN
jgi:hypothetical protein